MLTEKRAKIIGTIMLAVSVVLNAVSYFYLPAQLAMQRQLDGVAGNTMPKIIGLLIMIALEALFVMRFISSSKENFDIKSFLAGIIVLGVNVVVILFNL